MNKLSCTSHVMLLQKAPQKRGVICIHRMASVSITCTESQFYRQLDSVSKRRYREKLDMLHLYMDPYLTAPDVWIGSPESWPDVTFLPTCFSRLVPALKMTLRLTRAPKLGNMSLLVM